MKRVQYLHYGGPEQLRLDEVKQPDPGRGQIRVRVRAAVAKPMDWKIRRGELKALSGLRFPRGLGHDFAGVVEAVGPGVERLKVGNEVLGVTCISQAGAFAARLWGHSSHRCAALFGAAARCRRGRAPTSPKIKAF
jgi:NADPH:quinone reductase-like Zn-dependent oxidoreductase